MTAGVNVPFDLALIEDLYDALQRVRDPTAWLPNRRTNYLFEVPCKFPLFWVSALENIRV